MSEPGAGRRRRLAEELEESGLHLEGTEAFHEMLLEEIDHALRPHVHERRIASGGTILEPTSDPATWAPGTQLDITRKVVSRQPLPAVRRFADRTVELAPAPGSERDLVVLASVFDATIVQRHPAGSVRVVGSFGVLRWEGSFRATAGHRARRRYRERRAVGYATGQHAAGGRARNRTPAATGPMEGPGTQPRTEPGVEHR